MWHFLNALTGFYRLIFSPKIVIIGSQTLENKAELITFLNREPWEQKTSDAYGFQGSVPPNEYALLLLLLLHLISWKLLPSKKWSPWSIFSPLHLSCSSESMQCITWTLRSEMEVKWMWRDNRRCSNISIMWKNQVYFLEDLKSCQIWLFVDENDRKRYIQIVTFWDCGGSTASRDS